jgi:putative membrane protein
MPGDEQPEERPLAARLNPNLLRDRAANERTFLAWLRTGITLTALGFVVARFEVLLYEVARIDQREFDKSEVALVIGLLLVIAGPALVALAAWRYVLANRDLMRGGTGIRGGSAAVIVATSVGLALAGVGLLAHMIVAWPG